MIPVVIWYEYHTSVFAVYDPLVTHMLHESNVTCMTYDMEQCIRFQFILAWQLGYMQNRSLAPSYGVATPGL